MSGLQKCGNGIYCREFYRSVSGILEVFWPFFSAREFNMNRRDQELLDKQLSSLHLAPRHDGAMILAILAVFLIGMTAGSFLYAFTERPMQVAANDLASAVSPVPNPTIPYKPQIVRR
jgi:hypothetical protein